MDALWAQIIGAVVSGLVGAFVAWFSFWLQHKATLKAERRAAIERANIVRRTLSAEVEILLAGINPILDWKEGPAAALSTLGTLKVRVYPEVISELGVLGSDLAGQVVMLYAHVEHLIDRGLEIDRDLASGVRALAQSNADAQAWIVQLGRLLPGFTQTLAELRAGIKAI